MCGCLATCCLLKMYPFDVDLWRFGIHEQMNERTNEQIKDQEYQSCCFFFVFRCVFLLRNPRKKYSQIICTHIALVQHNSAEKNRTQQVEWQILNSAQCKRCPLHYFIRLIDISMCLKQQQQQHRTRKKPLILYLKRKKTTKISLSPQTAMSKWSSHFFSSLCIITFLIVPIWVLVTGCLFLSSPLSYHTFLKLRYALALSPILWR